MTKTCFYCSDPIDTEVDDFEKSGKKYICAFCWEESEESDEESDKSSDDSEPDSED